MAVKERQVRPAMVGLPTLDRVAQARSHVFFDVHHLDLRDLQSSSLNYLPTVVKPYLYTNIR